MLNDEAKIREKLLSRLQPKLPEKSKVSALHSINWYEYIDLKDHYSISPFFVVQRLLPVIFIWILLGFYKVFAGFTLNNFTVFFNALFSLLSVIIIFLGIYWEIYRRSLQMSIDGLRFSVTKGVLKKVSGSLTLRYNDVIYLYRTSSDVLFGLYQIQVFGSNQTRSEYAHLPALSKQDALDLFKFLTSELSYQVSI
jgi:hypothetical protein